MHSLPHLSIHVATAVEQPSIEAASVDLVQYKSNYRKQLPARVEEIEALLGASDRQKPAYLTRLYDRFYALAGTSGTFGAMSVSEEAGKLVDLLSPVIDQNLAPSPELLMDIEQGIQQLRQAALVDSEHALPFEPEESIEELAVHFPIGQNKKSEIFLLESDEALATYLTLFLEKLGHRVYAYRNPEAFLTVARGITPKAILIDLVFRNGAIEGDRIVTEIQSYHTRPIPVIFLSCRGDLSARMLAAGAQGSYYFKKPIDEHRLLMVLDHIALTPATRRYRVLMAQNVPNQSDDALEAVMQTAGIEVIPVGNPLQTLNAIAHFQPDQLVLALQSLDAALLTRTIRQHEAFSNLPIAVVAEDVTGAQILELTEAGADLCIPPGTPPALMARMLKAHMDRFVAVSRTPEAAIWSPTD